MTKMKSKKMTKSTFAIIIMAIAMVAMLAFGGTYAYFTAQTKTLNTGELTIGTVKLTSDGTAKIAATGTILPGATLISGNIGYTNAATVKTLVAVVMTIKIGDEDLTVGTGETVAGQLAKYGVTLSTTSNWATPEFDEDFGGFVYTLKDKVLGAAGEGTTAIPFTSAAVTFDATEHYDEETDKHYNKVENGTALDSSIQGTEITITITAYQTQLRYNADGSTLNETFANAQAVIGEMKVALGMVEED